MTDEFNNAAAPPAYDAAAPPAYDAAAAPANRGGASSRPTGLTPDAALYVVKSPTGVLRTLEWLLAMISFSAMANQTGYDAVASFEYVVAVGVLAWLFTPIAFVGEMLNWHAEIGQWKLVEMGADAIFSFLSFVAGVAGAAACSEEVFGSVKRCDNNAGDARAAIFVMFMLFAAFLGSTFFSFQRWRHNVSI